MYGALSVPVGSGYRPGYLTRPDRAGRYPTVIVAAGEAGVSATLKSVAWRMARRGLAVVAVDLWPDRTDRLSAYHRLDDLEAVRILDEVHDFLGSEDILWAHPTPVGLLGLDLGGRFALLQAAQGVPSGKGWVGAVVVVAMPLTGDEDRRFPVAGLLAHVSAPVLGLYGGADPLVATESVDEAQNRNPAGSWLLYDGAGHGFIDETGADYSEAAADDAVARLIEFFLARLPVAVTETLG